VLLAVAQLVLWPGRLLWDGSAFPGALPVAVVGFAALGVAVALGWRRRRPVAALAGVVAVLTVALPLKPGDVELLVGLADLVALYSVAAREPRRTWVAALGLLTLWQVLIGLPQYGVSTEWAVEAVLSAIAYSLAAGGGVARAQWLAGRRAAAEALRQAQAARQEAGSGERQRLSAELHDVSAHHLTSIVVTMNAARRLAASRPELVTESLTAAASTGRDALAELRTLLADTGPASAELRLDDQLTDLADAFGRLGQHVTVEAPDLGALPPPVTEAAYAVVREALTNTVRYAPGGAVRVRLALTTAGSDVGQLGIVVENDAGTGAQGAGRLGSGRGLAGLRRRIGALGGTLTAGPAGEGGWRVIAELPAAGRPVPSDARWWSDHRTPLFDASVAVLILVFSVIGLYMPDEEGWAIRPVALGWWPLLLIVVHIAPLLVRRRAPWLAWAGVFATVGLWPLWLTDEGVSDALAGALVFALCAEVVAVYTVGAHARHRWPSLLVVPASGAALAAAFVAEVASDGWQVFDEPGSSPVLALVAVLVGSGLLGVPIAVVWGGGFAVRLRRDGVVRREYSEVTAAVAAAELEARAERARLVGGLRSQVLRHTERVVAAADDGDPDEVLAEARAALAAMRALLTALDPPPSAPTPVTPAASGVSADSAGPAGTGPGAGGPGGGGPGAGGSASASAALASA